MENNSFSDKIRECRDGVISNPFQGTDKKVLFVCSMGILRSATAARIYGYKYNTRAAGTWSDALIPVTDQLMAWADEIVFVNYENYSQVKCYFQLEHQTDIDDVFNIRVLNIPDKHPHMHPELIAAFEKQYEPLSPRINVGPLLEVTKIWATSL